MGQGCYSCETSISSDLTDKMVMIKENEKTLEISETSATQESTNEVAKDVGFSSISKQIQRKEIRKGFRFKLMVVGQSGLGKSTFINTLFGTDIYINKDLPKITQKNVGL